MRKSLFLIALVVCIGGELMAQRRFIDHIVIDSSYMQGRVTLIGKGKLQFRASEMQSPTTYSLSDIKEYSQDGNPYEAMVINGNRRFHKRIVTGSASLYRIRRGLTVKINNRLTPLNKNNFRSVVTSNLNCLGDEGDASRLTYSKASLSFLVKRYNDGNCSIANLPYRKLGIIAGYNTIHMEALRKESTGKLIGDGKGPFVGLFVELPILYQRERLYFITEINWTSYNAGLYQGNHDDTHFLSLNVTGLSAMSGFRLTAKKGSVRPYLKMAVVASHSTVNAPVGFVETLTANSTTTISVESISDGSVSQFGYSAGAGLQIPLSKRKNIFIEGRTTRLFDAKWQSFQVNSSTFGLTAGFNI